MRNLSLLQVQKGPRVENSIALNGDFVGTDILLNIYKINYGDFIDFDGNVFEGCFNKVIFNKIYIFLIFNFFIIM